MALSEKFKGIVDFLAQGMGQNEDQFGDIIDEINEDYPIEDNLAIAPAYQRGFTTTPDRINDRNNDLKVVAHPSYKGAEVVVVEPRAFGEAAQIVQSLKDKKIIILNLHLLDKAQSQRTIDFICGAAHALNGKPQKVGEMFFVFTPSNVTLSVDALATQSKFQDSLLARTL